MKTDSTPNLQTVTKMKRYWINQPSTLQFAHEFHGQNVLAPETLDAENEWVTVYFTKGDTISARINRDALSDGWAKQHEWINP